MSIDMNYDDLVAMGLDHGARRIHFARLSSMYEDHIFVLKIKLSTFFCINMLRTSLLSTLFNQLNFLMLHFCLYHFGTGRQLTASLVSGRLLFLTRYIKLKRLLIPAASPSALFVLILFFSELFSLLSAFPRYHHCVSWQARTFRSVADSPGLILLAGCSSFAGNFPCVCPILSAICLPLVVYLLWLFAIPVWLLSL